MADNEQARKGGCVYILSNPAMPRLVKIDSTTLPPEVRARQLSTTGVPRPFQVIAFHHFEDEMRAERELQSMFRPHRVHRSREFYEITVEQAQDALLRLSNGKLISTASNLPSSATPPLGTEKPTSNTNASVLGFPYWSRFNKMRAEQELLPRFENAGSRFFHRHFLVTPSKRNGKRNIHYEGRIRINSPQVSMRLILKTADNIKELFDLIAQDRKQIEQEIGFILLWDRERGRYESHVAVERDDMDPRDIMQWNRQHEWLSEIVSAFERVICPRVVQRSFVTERPVDVNGDLWPPRRSHAGARLRSDARGRDGCRSRRVGGGNS